MKYHQLGNTGMYVSELCLGTMTYGGKGFWAAMGDLGLDAVCGQIKAAMEAGINFIDTADVYHEGLSEKLVGEALRKLGTRRSDLVIATKVYGRVGNGPNDVGLSRKHIFDSIDGSLQRMQLDYVDLYQVHALDTATPIEETLDALNDLVRMGKVRYLGFCNQPAWAVMKALSISEKKHQARYVSAQMYYSIAGRDIEREVVPLAQSEGLAILPWSPLAGGLLSGKFSRDGGPAEARRSAFDFPIVDKERAFACVDAMRPIADAHSVSVAQIALAYLLHKSFVTSVIIGARTQAQLEDNIAATKITLSREELSTLDAVSALPIEYPGWMIASQQRYRLVEGASKP